MTPNAPVADDSTLTRAPLPPELGTHRAPVCPEERLMLAILQDALACFHRGAEASGTSERELFTEACNWIFCRDRGWPFSFENICATFRIDPVYVRCALAYWVRLQLAPAGTRESIRTTLQMEEALACMQTRDGG